MSRNPKTRYKTMKIANIDRGNILSFEQLEEFEWNFQERCDLW